MRKILLHILLVSTISSGLAQSNTLQYYYNEARLAQKNGDHPKFYEMIKEAHKLHPYHQGILYQTGMASALNGRTEEAVDFLTRAIYVNADFDLTIPELKTLEGNAAFENLKKIQIESRIPIINSDTAFLIRDRSLHAESVATGEKDNTFYLGSIHKRKIIYVDEEGKASDFTSEAQDGITSVFGIKIDRKTNTLWACSSPTTEMRLRDSTALSSVFKYDIKSKKLISRYSPDEKKEHIFGDITLSPTGKVFVSDTKNNIIFTVNESKGILEEWFTSSAFWNLQGLAFTPDEKYLFIADYVRGIFRLDTQSKELILIKTELPVSVKSVDGLSYYNNSLITIQNMINPMRVTQLILNKTKDAFTSYKIIDRGHPAFNEPTTGCVSGDHFYYLANSQWSGYDELRNIKPTEQLQDIVVLKADLKKLK